MPARNQREVMSAPGPYEGRLAPWADAVTDAPGWQITTRSRRLAGAVAVAIPGATVVLHQLGRQLTAHPHGTSQVRSPAVTIIRSHGPPR
jgi:hypothetical protein